MIYLLEGLSIELILINILSINLLSLVFAQRSFISLIILFSRFLLCRMTLDSQNMVVVLSDVFKAGRRCNSTRISLI